MELMKPETHTDSLAKKRENWTMMKAKVAKSGIVPFTSINQMDVVEFFTILESLPK